MTFLHIVQLVVLLTDPRRLCSYDYRIREPDGAVFENTAHGKVSCADSVECADKTRLPEGLQCRVRAVVGGFEYVQPFGGGTWAVISQEAL